MTAAKGMESIKREMLDAVKSIVRLKNFLYSLILYSSLKISSNSS